MEPTGSNLHFRTCALAKRKMDARVAGTEVQRPIGVSAMEKLQVSASLIVTI